MRDRIAVLESHAFLHLYPSFWQWFLSVFGGLILEDYRDQDYDLLSAKTGVPKDHVDEALSVYDILFPTESGWFAKSPYSNITHIKLFSVPFLGNGVNYRRLRYSPDQTFEKLNLTGLHTHDDVGKWNNCLVEILAK